MDVVKHFPALESIEFQAACVQLVNAWRNTPPFHRGSSPSGQWHNLDWTGEELRIRQSRNQRLKTTPTKPISSTDDIADIEDDHDPEALLRSTEPCDSDHSPTIIIEFSIILSASYQVPVLWFSLPSLPTSATSALDRVYDLLVSPASQQGLRQIGVLGGISLADHPVSSLPAFFIHPCRTQEALNSVRPDGTISPAEYLMLWFGVIAPTVELEVPMAVAKMLSSAP